LRREGVVGERRSGERDASPEALCTRRKTKGREEFFSLDHLLVAAGSRGHRHTNSRVGVLDTLDRVESSTSTPSFSASNENARS
jgi:hypothetical protein